MPAYIHVPKETLRKLYVDQHLSSGAISKLIGIHECTIMTKLRQYEIPVRSRLASIRMANSKPTLAIGTIEHPLLGDVRRVGEIRPNVKNPSTTMVWAECLDCKTQRWIFCHADGKPDSLYCDKCINRHSIRTYHFGPKHHNWKGGRYNHEGYTWITLNPSDFFYTMTKQGRVQEHRYVMAQYLGRLLQPWEIVHHKNGNRSDNRIENLELSKSGSHTLLHNKGYKDGYARGYQDGRNKKIKELEAEIERLKMQLGEQDNA